MEGQRLGWQWERVEGWKWDRVEGWWWGRESRKVGVGKGEMSREELGVE